MRSALPESPWIDRLIAAVRNGRCGGHAGRQLDALSPGAVTLDPLSDILPYPLRTRPSAGGMEGRLLHA